MTPIHHLTISVALCTYNGTAYLSTQWQSLLEQQQLPDEVVVCDDKSTDGTIELVNQLAANAPFTVRIIENKEQLGFNKNFECALKACTGDLIFLCDQDDFWLPEKIITMTKFMNQHPQTQLAFCDAWVTDAHLMGREKHFWDVVRFNKMAQDRWQAGEAMEILLDGNRMMGCATVIRKDFLNYVLPIPSNLPGDYIYDGWMALVGAACNTITFIDKPLQLYRTHVAQQVGVRPPETVERIRLRDRITRHRARKLAPLAEKKVVLTKIDHLLNERVPTDAPGLPQLHRSLSHFSMRSSLPPNRLKRLLPVLTSMMNGNYKRYAEPAANWYAPYLAVLGDILE
jgi:glycosyltransferase involved in cell wall biosynthesis